MKKLFLSLLLFCTSGLLYSQACCVLLYSIKGNISGNWTSDSIQVFIPSTRVLVGYEKKLSGFTKFWIKKTEANYEIKTSSHLSSEFCSDVSSIVENVFKGKNKTWKIMVRDGKQTKVKLIDVKGIKFIQVSEEPFSIILEIELPEISFKKNN